MHALKKLTIKRLVVAVSFALCFSMPAHAANLECANCYYCTQYSGGSCVGGCVYDSTYCAYDAPYNPDGCEYFEVLHTEVWSADACSNGSFDTYWIESACGAVNDYDDCVQFLVSGGERFVRAVCDSPDIYTASINSGITGCEIGEAVEDISPYCETIIQVVQSCAKYTYLPEHETNSGNAEFLPCDGSSAPMLSDDLLLAICGSSSVCFDTLASDWYSFYPAICDVGDASAADMADYMGYDCVAAGYDMDFGVACNGCDSNMYYNGSECVPCPSEGNFAGRSTVSGFRNPISTCYIPANTTITDASGNKFIFENDCAYTTAN